MLADEVRKVSKSVKAKQQKKQVKEKKTKQEKENAEVLKLVPKQLEWLKKVILEEAEKGEDVYSFFGSKDRLDSSVEVRVERLVIDALRKEGFECSYKPEVDMSDDGGWANIWTISWRSKNG